jgi:hypothetical protein
MMQAREQNYEQRWKAEERFRWVASSQGGAVIASAAILPQSMQWSADIADNRTWDADFTGKFEALRSQIQEARQQSQVSYEALLDSLPEGDTDYAMLRQMDQVRDMWRSLRNDGVENRWVMERFLAQEGGASARDVLGYINDDGISTPYDDTQWGSLTGIPGARVADDGITLHGHHVNDVSSGLTQSVRDIGHLDDPDNIRLMTAGSHLRDPVYGHGGSFQNPTTGEASEVERRYADIRGGNRERVFEEAAGREAGLAIGSGILFGSIAATIRLYQLRRDPRPWKQKAGLAAAAFALRGAEAGIVSFVALGARGHVTELVIDSADSIAESMGEAFSGDVLTEILGSAAGVGAAMVVRTGLRAIQEYRTGVSIARIGNSAGQQLIVIAGEFGAFVLLGIALDAVMPDPTGVLVAGRIVYSLGKAGYNYHQNIQSQRACVLRRIDVLHEQAIIGLLPPSTAPTA